MKLENLKRDHIFAATKLIEEQGIPKDSVWSQYYVVVNGKEYPFKHLVRTAYMLATNEKLQFQSNDSYRGYVENTLGFNFRYYKGGYNFFTKEELDFYSSIVKEDYRTSNPEQQYYNQKLYPIIAKTKYWAEQIMIDGFKLKQDGNWLTGYTSKIKPYFWPRIFKGEDKDIFFNVEVNGEDEFIGYKLDGYFETTKALPDYKIELLQDYKKLINWEWPRIPFDKIVEYDWERLIAESKDYVKSYLSYHDHLKSILSKESKICRISWNTNKWIKPSGRLGKSNSLSFEKENGFGHEEWLFDGDKVIDDYKYGFLEPINKYYSKYVGNSYDITLYTRDSVDKINYWVANIKEVEVISNEEAEKVLAYYKKEGWYDSMKSDLYNLNLDTKKLDEWVKEGAYKLFNIKFKSSLINELPLDLIPISSSEVISTYHYTLLDSSSNFQNKTQQNENKGFDFAESGTTGGALAKSSSRSYKVQDIELDLKHNEIQEKFQKYLQNIYGKEIVKRECRAYASSRIDLVRKTETGYIFYEIKTYNNLRTSIREGIGQLLEYCFYPNDENAEEIVLVSHIAPNEEIKAYFNLVKKNINIPLRYLHFDVKQEKIISEI